jgi:hypothetical protein
MHRPTCPPEPSQLVQWTMVLAVVQTNNGAAAGAGLAKSDQFCIRRAFDYEGIARKACARRPRPHRPECATRLLSIGGHFTTRIALFIVLSSTRRQITWVRKGSQHLSVLCRFRAAIICAGRDVTGGSRAQSHGSRHSGIPVMAWFRYRLDVVRKDMLVLLYDT